MTTRLTHCLLAAAMILPATTMAQPGERGPRPGRDGGPPAEQRQGHRERERPDRRPAELPVEMVDQALATLQALHPDAEWLPRIAELVKTDQAEAAKALARFPRILELIEARLNRPEEFALHVNQARLMREVFPLVRQYREAKRKDDQATQDELRPQIRERVSEIFENRLAMKRIEIERLRTQLEAAENELAKIESNKAAEIDARLDDMLGRERRRRGGDDGERRRDREREGNTQRDRD